jgi:hypothetical protein
MNPNRMWEFLSGSAQCRTYSEMSRLSAIINIATSAPAVGNPNTVIWDAVDATNLERLAELVEERFPDFWIGLPVEENTQEARVQCLRDVALRFGGMPQANS